MIMMNCIAWTTIFTINAVHLKQAYLDAVLKGDAVSVEKLLQSRAIEVDTPLKSGMTALMLVSNENYVAVAKLLLKHGASVQATDKYGQTPLHIAASSGNYEIVKLLVGAFSDLNATSKVCHAYYA